MGQRPPSAISLITAVGAGLALIGGAVALIMHRVPGYFALWCVVLAAVIAFNLWAARGSHGK